MKVGQLAAWLGLYWADRLVVWMVALLDVQQVAVKVVWKVVLSVVVKDKVKVALKVAKKDVLLAV